MTVAFDAATPAGAGGTTFTTANPFTFDHTPVGTPRAVVVFVAAAAVSSDVITGTVSYGGVAMTRVPTDGFAADTAGESGSVYAYFLGSSIPTGTQTVSIAHTASAQVKWPICLTFTAAADTEIGDSGRVEENTVNPSVALDTGANASLRTGVLFSGTNDLGNITAGTDISAVTSSPRFDFGTTVACVGIQTSAASSGSFAFEWTVNDDTAMIAIAIQEAGAATQPLTGTLFTKAPTFSTGVVGRGAVNLAGALFTKSPTFFVGNMVQVLHGTLFTKAPTFPTGAITATRNLAGVLFQKAPAFFTGAFDAGPAFLTGTLFTKAPTFFVGGIIESQALAGVLFTKAPTFNAGSLAATYDLEGVLFQKAPTFPQGSVTSTRNLAGTTFTKAPSFFVGTLTLGAAPVDGELFENDPLFFSGVLSQQGGPQLLGGVLFTKAPTFPQGTVSAGAVGLTGVLFQKAPTFSVGSIATTYNLAGVLYQNAPFFSQGEVIGAQLVEGVLFSNTPLFPAGSIGVAGAIDGVLFQKAPTFFVGAMGQVGGSFWRPNPAGYTLNPAAFDPVLRDEVPPWAIEVDGEEFELAPSFFAGALS